MCSMSNSLKKHQHPPLNITTTQKNMDTNNIDFLGLPQISSIPYFLIHQFSSIQDQMFTKYEFRIILI